MSRPSHEEAQVGLEPAAGTRLTLTLSGALTIYEAPRTKEDLLSALGRATQLTVDLSAVEELDTAGLQLLVLAQREAQRRGKRFDLQAPSAAVQEVLDRYRIAGLPVLGQPTHREEPHA